MVVLETVLLYHNILTFVYKPVMLVINFKGVHFNVNVLLRGRMQLLLLLAQLSYVLAIMTFLKTVTLETVLLRQLIKAFVCKHVIMVIQYNPDRFYDNAYLMDHIPL